MLNDFTKLAGELQVTIDLLMKYNSKLQVPMVGISSGTPVPNPEWVVQQIGRLTQMGMEHTAHQLFLLSLIGKLLEDSSNEELVEEIKVDLQGKRKILEAHFKKRDKVSNQPSIIVPNSLFGRFGSGDNGKG